MKNKEINLKLIKQKRIEEGFTLNEMAKELGLSNGSNYLKYENGDYKLKADMIPTLSKKLGIGITKFFK